MDLRWKVLALVFLARSGLGVQFQTLGSLGSELQADLAINLSQFGWLVGLFMIAGVFLSFPAGMLGRWFADRKIIAVGLTLLAAGGVLGASSDTYALLAVGRVICGAGFVLGTLYFAKVISDWFAGRELATAMGVLVMSWPIGIAVSQVVAPWLASLFSWQAAFHAASLWCLLGAMSIWLLLPAKPAASPAPAAATTPATAMPTPTPAPDAFLPRHWVLTLIAALTWGAFNAGFVVYLSFIDIRLNELGYLQATSAWLASLPSWIMPFAAILAGQWADRTGQRDLIIYLASACALVAMLLLAYTPLVLPAVLLFGCCGASAAGVIMALSVEAMPSARRAFGMGIFFTVFFICGLPSPALAGWLADLGGSASIALAFAGLLFLITALTTAWFRRQQQRYASHAVPVTTA